MNVMRRGASAGTGCSSPPSSAALPRTVWVRSLTRHHPTGCRNPMAPSQIGRSPTPQDDPQTARARQPPCPRSSEPRTGTQRSHLRRTAPVKPPIVPCRNAAVGDRPRGRWQRTSLPHRVRHQPTRSGEDEFPWAPVAKTITIGHWHRGVIPSGKDPCGSAMPTVRDLEGTTSRVLPGGASPIPEGEALLRSIGVAALRHHCPTTSMAGARNASTTRGFDVRTSIAPSSRPAAGWNRGWAHRDIRQFIARPRPRSSPVSQ